MNDCVRRCDQAYHDMRFRDALQIGFYEMQGIRNAYRDACAKMDVPMEKPLLARFAELECVMLAPIVPHFCDNIWRFVLGKTQNLWRNSWPEVPAVDAVLTRSIDFVRKNVRNLRESVNKKPKKAPATWKRPNKVYVYCARVPSLAAVRPAHSSGVLRRQRKDAACERGVCREGARGSLRGYGWRAGLRDRVQEADEGHSGVRLVHREDGLPSAGRGRVHAG